MSVATQHVIDPLTQWERSVGLFVTERSRCGGVPDSWFVGRLRRNTRLFRAGDLVVGTWWNGGGERQPVWAFSSRGYKVVHFYLPYTRFLTRPKEHFGERFFELEDNHRPAWLPYSDSTHTDRTTMQIVELPDALTKLSPADPAVRRYAAETLCAGDAAAR